MINSTYVYFLADHLWRRMARSFPGQPAMGKCTFSNIQILLNRIPVYGRPMPVPIPTIDQSQAWNLVSYLNREVIVRIRYDRPI
jgi:hypothetical protein